MKKQEFEDTMPEDFIAEGSGDGLPVSPRVQVANSASSIKISIDDPSESGNALAALKDIQHFLASNIERNVSVFFSSTPANNSTKNPDWLMSSPIGFPPASSDMISTPPGYKSSGFPAGYFRIRAAGTNFYWSVHYGDIHEDGNALHLWNWHGKDEPEQTFFVNTKGELSTRGLGIDVMGSTLILSQGRPPTSPWPNPWSHPLPTFAYSPSDKTISVKFHADPIISNKWPRPESEWKAPHKTFFVSARPPSVTKIYSFSDISRWAPDGKFIGWTHHAGDTWGANQWNGLGVVDEKDVLSSAETDFMRIRWELEQV